MSDTEQPDAQTDEGVPQTLVGISFPDIFRAQEFLTAADRPGGQGRLKLKDAVLVVKDADGKTHVKETIDPEPGPHRALRRHVGRPVRPRPGRPGGLGGRPGRRRRRRGGHGQGRGPRHLRRVGRRGSARPCSPRRPPWPCSSRTSDRDALVEEAARFTGAELVYANLEEDTLERIKDALAGHTTTTEADIS